MRCQKHHEVLSLRSKVKHFEDGREYSKLSDEIIRKDHKIDSLQKEKEKLRTEIKELHRKNYEMESELKAEQNSYETLLNAYNNLNNRVTESDLILSDRITAQMDNPDQSVELRLFTPNTTYDKTYVKYEDTTYYSCDYRFQYRIIN